MIALDDAWGASVAAGVAVGDNVAVTDATGVICSASPGTISVVVGTEFVGRVDCFSSSCF